ncbi:MAG: DUF2147 domain-containing protein [Paludibacteraceae bacterium]|nr:DUF2147 domain-containing protein [Paludibacteraceae bacterium]
MKKIIVSFLLALVSLSSFSQVDKIVGEWKTVDDKTGNSYAMVRIYKGTDGLYYGKIVKMLWPGSEDMVCTECEGADHNQPIVGLIILRGMREENGQLVGGRCLDPESGKFYYGKLFLKDGRLVLRGSLDKKGILGRNQTWIRA